VGKQCPGYPEETTRLFRNYSATPPPQALPGSTSWENADGASTLSESGESSTTEQRIFEVPRSPESSLSSPPSDRHPNSQDLTESTSTSEALVLRPMPQSDVEELSISLYFATYVSNPRLSHNRDDFYFLPKMFATADRHSCLHRAVKLVGLASFANRWNPANFEKQIREGYAHAIQATNAALRDHVEYLQDETLMAVWLLGAFEVITPPFLASLF
jgi:hypothetical protein